MTKDYTEYIEENTIRCEVDYRGGGIEISLGDLIKKEGYAMTAYQNYLGGGLLGRICNSYNFDIEALPETKRNKIITLTKQLNRYFHNLTNHEYDEWESETYEQNQNKPVSAY